METLNYDNFGAGKELDIVNDVYGLTAQFADFVFDSDFSDVNATRSTWETAYGAATSPYKTGLVLSSVAFFCGLYPVLDLLFTAASQTYRQIALKDKRRWLIGVIRGVAGFMLTYYGYKFFFSGDLQQDSVFGTTEFTLAANKFALGFFIFENLNLLGMWWAHGILEVPLLAHHILGLWMFATAVATSGYHFYTTFVLVEELSAPFTTMSWILTKMNMEKHPLWFINQCTLLLVWVFVRMSSDCIYWYFLISDFPNSLSGSCAKYPILLGATVLSFYLNPLWLKMKYAQLTRALDKLSKPEKAMQ
eukprot:Colp12_sorted_trinity150504_noHs@17868